MRKTLIILLTAVTLLSTSGCVFRASISQGNIVEQEDLDQLAVGMTQNQVRFLLGTPMLSDPFHADRWDYVYYLKVGRRDTAAKRWVSVLFDDNGLVSEIRKDQELDPDL
ncbi:MAG: outer membrane protein assembly factor BamE [Woeseiaceae bacterium]|nr:outer membrane protein assembly factor BamE [Woeseiaceae bacterium]